MGRCFLFVYGLLQPGFHPPKSMTGSWPDEVAGELYDLGPYPGAVGIGAREEWFHGSVLEVDEAELAALDEFEDVTSGREFVRKRATTRGGREVWIYEYNRSVPLEAKRVMSWPAR